MPVKYMESLKVPQGARAPSRRQLDGGPSDFLCRPRCNIRSKCFGHELRAETNAECRAQKTHTLANQRQFVREKRIDIFVVDADWSAQHDKEIGAFDVCVLKAIHADVKVSRFEPAVTKNWRQCTQVFKRDVA